jgi:hypothetical protein
VLLEFGQLPVQDAVKLYQQYTSKINFIEDLPLVAAGHPAAAPAEPVVGQPRTTALPAVPPPVHHQRSEAVAPPVPGSAPRRPPPPPR